jgi:hypothetical protein
MTRAVVLLGGGRGVSGEVTRLLGEGSSVVLVEAPDVLSDVVQTVAPDGERRRFACLAGDPAAPESRAAAIELAREIHGVEVPEVVEFDSGLDPPVK